MSAPVCCRAHAQTWKCVITRTHKPHTATCSKCTDGKVAGVISRIRRTQEKNLRSTQTNPTPLHTHTHTRFVSHPPGCLLSCHPNPLKITFSYYPNNGGTECNFNSRFRKKNETGRNRTPRRSLACSSRPFPAAGWRSEWGGGRREGAKRRRRRRRSEREREVGKAGEKFK